MIGIGFTEELRIQTWMDSGRSSDLETNRSQSPNTMLDVRGIYRARYAMV